MRCAGAEQDSARPVAPGVAPALRCLQWRLPLSGLVGSSTPANVVHVVLAGRAVQVRLEAVSCSRQWMVACRVLSRSIDRVGAIARLLLLLLLARSMQACWVHSSAEWKQLAATASATPAVWCWPSAAYRGGRVDSVRSLAGRNSAELPQLHAAWHTRLAMCWRTGQQYMGYAVPCSLRGLACENLSS